MKLGRVLVLGVAVGAGLVAAMLAWNLVNRSPAPAPQPPPVTADAPPPPLPKVMVAAVDIPIGTTISREAIDWRDWPESGVAANYIKFVDGPDQTTPIVGSIARATFYANEPIIQDKLIRSDQGYMATILPEGMRAIATGISVVTSAGGFILPNDRVDLIMVTTNTAGESISEVILSNIRVLAIDQMIQEQDGKKDVVGQTATLELSPQQAQILATAQATAQQLVLSLRSIKDSQPGAESTGEDAVHLIDGSKRKGVVTVVKAGSARDVGGLK
jgi:pilus assembly protein CpaB